VASGEATGEWPGPAFWNDPRRGVPALGDVADAASDRVDGLELEALPGSEPVEDDPVPVDRPVAE
jgi:hypothetical protein